MNNWKTFYITTPIYYPSDKLHLGHSYATVAADAIARFKRLTGFDVWFLTGTDEHGQKIQRQANAAGKEPWRFVDEIVVWIKELWAELDISYDDFIRTTESRHKNIVQKMFTRFYEQGDIYKGKYEGWYCTPCEAFWRERQLNEKKCPDCGHDAELVAEEAYFFRMAKYADRLIEHIEKNEDFIQPPSRKNEMINNFLKPGLEDLCVSRSTFDWGIPVSFDRDYIIYVWLDALSNYITALGYNSADDTLYRHYWPADVHLIGKEIVRFHTIYWPIFLMALDVPLPKQVFGHGWLILQEGKMSKSKGNVVDPRLLINRYGSDALRYYLLREIPFGADGEFSIEALVQRINSDLANDLGNLVSRTFTMVERYFSDGVLQGLGVAADGDAELVELALQLPGKMEEYMNNLQISNALAELWQLVRQCNRYIDRNTPWDLAREQSEEGRSRLGTVMYNLVEGIRFVAVLLQPFMPRTPERIWSQLGLDEKKELQTWESLQKWGGMPANQRIRRGEDLFPRRNLNDELIWSGAKEDISRQPAKIADTANDDETVGLITIDDFQKADLRVGIIRAAEKISGADKLLKLKIEVDNGNMRQVIAGIARYYAPEDLPGQKILLLANLQPAKIRGELSEGMILAAGDGEGNLGLVTVDRDIRPGSKVS